MNIEHDNDHDTPLPDGLRRSLRALRRDDMPAADLWPAISARIAASRQDAPAPSTDVPPSFQPLPISPVAALRTPASRPWRSQRSRRFAGLATAASLAAVLAIGWAAFAPSMHAPAPSTTAVASAPILREAARMTREYRTAWRAFDARRPAGIDTSALHEIDRNAAQVRAALHQDPEARYLFERLQSLYALRLDLSRRLATIPDAVST
jgi:hypothetical protein